MRYGDSFRCEGGGIGAGWCMSDRGVRPIKRLDKLSRMQHCSLTSISADVYSSVCEIINGPDGRTATASCVVVGPHDR